MPSCGKDSLECMMASSIQGTGICQNIPYCEIYLPSEQRKSSEPFFHYFAEWIAFRFLYREKGCLAKIDSMDNLVFGQANHAILKSPKLHNLYRRQDNRRTSHLSLHPKCLQQSIRMVLDLRSVSF